MNVRNGYLIISNPAVQGCDATAADKSGEAGNIKKMQDNKKPLRRGAIS